MIKNLFEIIKLVIKHGKLSAIILFIIITTNGALMPLNIWILQNIIDSTINQAKNNGSLLVVLPWILAFIFILLYYNLRELLEQILKTKITHRLRDNFLPIIADKVLNLEYWCFEDSKTNDLISRVGNSPENTFAQVYWEILFIPSYIVNIIGYVLLLSNVSWLIVCLVFLLSIPALLKRLNQAKETYSFNKERTIEERKASYLSSLITGRDVIKETRIFRLHKYLNEKWRTYRDKLLNDRISLNLKQQKDYIFVEIASMIIIFGGIISFIYSTRNGIVTYGQFVALCGSLTGIVELVTWQIPYQLSNIRNSSIYWDEYIEFINLPEVSHSKDKIEKISLNTKIEFRDVTFTYPNTDRQILKGVNFHLNKGETVAIAGKNGAGKSTIIKLLLGMYTPDRGTIAINDVDLSDINLESRRHLFSVIFQDFFKYNLTVRENIGFGKVKNLNNDELILEAAKKGMSHNIIIDMPNGIDTNLGKIYEEGTDLSVGQWQRIAISRACMADSEVIILDEPTSALDPIAESDLYNNFANTISNRTAILISHRLGSARMADRILVVDDGKVVEEGSHDDLIKDKGFYYKMFKTQAEWYREGEGHGHF